MFANPRDVDEIFELWFHVKLKQLFGINGEMRWEMMLHDTSTTSFLILINFSTRSNFHFN